MQYFVQYSLFMQYSNIPDLFFFKRKTLDFDKLVQILVIYSVNVFPS